MTPIFGPGESQFILPREAIELAQTALTMSFRACDEAGAVLKKHYGRLKSIDEKFQAGLVSEADRESEDTIKRLIHDQFPDHQILGEETGLSSDSGGGWKALWMIDPLDGTTNYVHRVPFFCISMGLEIEIKIEGEAGARRELLVGVVDAPLMNWRYHAIRGQGAFLNGSPIEVSKRSEFREGLFATGFSNSDNTLDQQMELLLEVIRKARGIRRLGAAALDLCMVAEGVFDGFWERNLQPWDTAAGVLIAREAGAVATDFMGRTFVPTYKSVLCAPPAQHEHVLQHMKRVGRR